MTPTSLPPPWWWSPTVNAYACVCVCECARDAATLPRSRSRRLSTMNRLRTEVNVALAFCARARTPLRLVCAFCNYNSSRSPSSMRACARMRCVCVWRCSGAGRNRTVDVYRFSVGMSFGLNGIDIWFKPTGSGDVDDARPEWPDLHRVILLQTRMHSLRMCGMWNNTVCSFVGVFVCGTVSTPNTFTHSKNTFMSITI